MTRKPVPGFRYFYCTTCSISSRETTRDCLSPSNDYCECGEVLDQTGIEQHPEWETDEGGNLIRGKKYE